MPKTFQCHCGQKFTSHRNYQDHQANCQRYVCSCGQIFTRNEDYNEHVVQCKKTKDKPSSSKQSSSPSSTNAPKSYTKCPLCSNKDFKTRKNLTLHKQNTHTIEVTKTDAKGQNKVCQVFVCPICAHRVTTWQSLLSHFEMIHKRIYTNKSKY